MRYKIFLKVDNRDIIFSTNSYELKDDLIFFTDKFGKEQVWNTSNLINIKEVEE